ncbi:MAG: cytochrome oxidase subunit III, partial [Cytophagales bacterium]|nr:cytochrome oxidase subunit III [Cytophagales bacterium]
MNQNSTSITLKQVPQGRLGIWMLIAGELVIFGGLIAAYLLYRFRFPEWAEQAKYTSTLLGGINTFVLLTSSYFVVMAHSAAVKKEFSKIKMWMGLAVGCGLIFLVVKSI